MFPGIEESLAAYNLIDRAKTTERRAFRNAHPEINAYWDWLYGDWTNGHPTWDKYYGSEDSSTTSSTSTRASTAARSSRSSSRRSYSTRSVSRSGSATSSSGTTTSGSTPYYIPGVPKATQDQWHAFRNLAGDALYAALNNYWDSQTPLKPEELSLLQTLFRQYSFGAKDFQDWLDNILPNLRSAMIPGASIFSSTKMYQNDVTQPQTGFGHYRHQYWFQTGSNA